MSRFLRRRLSVESLEDRAVPAGLGAIGSEGATASLIDLASGQPRFTVTPFGSSFTGGVRAVAADVTGDTVPDLVTTGGSEVAVFHGVTGEPVARFSPFESPGGLNVAAGDVNADGFADVIVAARAGAGPRVAIHDGRTGSELRTWFAFDASFLGGVHVAAADVNGDGRCDVALGAGEGGGPHVRVFSGATGVELVSRFAYEPEFRGGVNVAAGDADKDGTADIITGAGVGGGPHVRCFRGSDGTEMASFFAGDSASRNGVLVGCEENGPESHILAQVPGGPVLAYTGSATAPGVPASTLHPATQVNAALAWNDVALRTIAASGTAPPLAARNLAILHTAVFEAVNAVTHRYKAYHFSGPAPAETSAEVAANAAAHRVLTKLFPAHAAKYDAVRDARLGVLPDGAAKDASVTLGQAAAEAILALRTGDIPAAESYPPGSAPGDWVPTPPAFTPFALPHWGKVKPFAISSPAAFRPAGPPALTSAEYAAAWDEVRRLGRAEGSERTADQTQVALFWAAGAGTITPPGMCLRIAADAAHHAGQDLTDSARTLALVSVAVADAGIVAWDAKRLFANWRPVTAIQQADTDGNPATQADPTWSPLLATPSFPDYVSGHSTFSSAAAAVLEALFGANVPVRTNSEAVPDVSRTFPSFAEAAAEAGKSRVYGGIHFEFANRDALASGREIGRFVAGHLLSPA